MPKCKPQEKNAEIEIKILFFRFKAINPDWKIILIIAMVFIFIFLFFKC